MATRHWIGTLALGLAVALPSAAPAQDVTPKTKTESKTHAAKTKGPKGGGKTEKTKGSASGASESVTDSWITMKIKTDVSSDSTLKDSDVTIATKTGIVTLKGTVASEAAKARAEEIARKTQGVTKVVDDLSVKAR